ncbi:MAG: ribose-phosphate pyrophosphokinase [Gammaproteobacteria bacterium CG11_big_fil_rev_8_21_14_0_20_46_22]|nr:MAG: ribose-phosphate pyrophosphokinase [Gammaproteobacteria bacterium CG12_big_fil_rev_8_21_14_0_65_46_12]PIR10740.1 MAG: ribose-phosphate pyrophosphokinase [Gammaproteobacteria bacterium CG11_big_fil_rev_8_21_14_0_20_46_22]
MSDMILFTGNANPELAEKIAQRLNTQLGKAEVNRFSDGEISVTIKENVRGSHAYIIQSTSAPANENLMELVIMADALRRSSVKSITAVVPYYGYARQDRRVRSARVPITARVVADMMASVGIGRLMTVDLHADQIQGFFYSPVDNVYTTPLMLQDIKARYPDLDKLMIVSPDVGGVLRARALAKQLPGSDLAIIDKRREKANESEVMHIIGDVAGANCIIVDDIIDTAGTMVKAAQALKESGANSVVAYATHPVLSGPAIERVAGSCLDELVVTDTIALTAEAQACSKIRQISIASTLAESIRRVSGSESLSSLFS